MGVASFFGSCSGSSAGDYIYYIEATLNSQDINRNVSNVTIKTYLHCKGGYNNSAYNLYTDGRNWWQESINGGQVVSGSGAIDTRNQVYVNLGSWTGDVGHNGDGTCTLNLSSSFGMGNSNLSGGSVSGAWTLPTIPRASTITTFDNFTIGNNIPVVISRKSGSFTQDIHLYVGNTFVCARSNIPDNYTLILTAAEQDIIYNAIPNAASGGTTLYCLTYSGSTQIGSTQSKTATASVGSGIVPTFDTITAEETVETVKTEVGTFVQNLSRILCTITGAIGVKGSTITSYQISIDGSASNGNLITSGPINKNGSISIVGTVTDSRGRTCSKTENISLLPYSMPSITGFSIVRADADGSLNAMGEYAKVTSIGGIQSLPNPDEKNILTYTIYSRVRGEAYWTQQITTDLPDLILNSIDILGNYPATESFDFRLDVADKFNTTISLDVLPTGRVTLSLGNNGVGVGKVWERGGLDVAGDIYENDIRLRTPSGVINQFGGAEAPVGWLLCQGQAVSRDVYSDLFAVLGTTYGAGDGSTTFNLPNLQGKIPVGLDPGQSEFNGLAKTGGEKTHVLSAGEMPSHSGHHNPWPGTAGAWGYVSTTVGGIWTPYGSVGRGWTIQNSNELIPYTESKGGGLAHNNLQPYIVLNYIIKI